MDKNKNYFTGIYLKHQNESYSIAFIPSIHCNKENSYAMIQVISDDFTREYYFDQYDISDHEMTFFIGGNVFSKEGIYVDLTNEEGRIHGHLFYDDAIYPDHDIMGFFQYLPNMECSHRVISLQHRIHGTLLIDDQKIDFNEGKGYIEGDRGNAFPKRYLWTQCLFQSNSIMISAATIPYLKLHFNGCIALILYQGRQYRLATYKGAKIAVFQKDCIVIKQGKYTLKARHINKFDRSFLLKAPTMNGMMQRKIAESISTNVYYEFSIHDKIVLSFLSNRASFEYSDTEI